MNRGSVSRKWIATTTAWSRARSGTDRRARSTCTTGTTTAACRAKKSASARSATRDWDTADHAPNRYERNLSWTRAGFTELDHNRDGQSDQQRMALRPRNVPSASIAIATTRSTWPSSSAKASTTFAATTSTISTATTTAASSAPNGTAALDEFRCARSEQRRHPEPLRSGRLADRASTPTTSSPISTTTATARLERGEWHWSNVSFTQRDTNRDGILSRAEFDAAGGAPGTVGAVGGRPARADGPRQLAAALDRHRHHGSRRRRRSRSSRAARSG